MSDSVQTSMSLQEKRELLSAVLRRVAGQADSSYSLSSGQQALWFLYQSAKDNAAYNTAFAARISCAVDEVALRQAFHDVVLRHPSLRTTFSASNGEIVQQVHTFQDLQFERVDMHGASEQDLRDAAGAHYRQPFDLEHGPCLRMTLFTRDHDDHILLVTVHHIVSDAWSLWIVADEVTSLYAAALSGEQISLAPPTSTYAQYVQWQKQLLIGREGEQLRDYWASELAGELPVLILPSDRPRPPVRSWEGASLNFELSGDLWKRLGALAESQGATLFTVLLASFEVLLHRYSGQDEFTFGTLTNGRTRTEFSSVVGYFVNPVVVRANLNDNPSFSRLLAVLRERVLGALAHQDYPFPMLVEQLRPVHDGSRTPFMDVLFVYQQRQLAREASSAGGPLRLLPFEIPQMEGQFDITLEVTEGGRSVLKYDTALFDAETIAQMSRHFDFLLNAITSRPDMRVADLPLLTEQDCRQREVWNDTSVEFESEVVLHDLFSAQVERTPDNAAVIADGRTVSYRELDGYANSLARRLRNQGAGPDKLVGVCLNRSIEMVVALFGILKAGAAYVPLDPSYPRQRLELIARNGGLQLVLTEPRTRALFEDETHGCPCLTLELAELSPELAEDPIPDLTPDHLAYVIYTSGSTGEPKGAMNTHRAICNRLMWMQREYGMRPHDRVLQKTPFSFDVSVWEFFWPLLHGASLVMARPGGHLDRAYLRDTINAEQITILHFVPSMLRAFLQEPGIETCRSLRHVFCSGEALPAQLQDEFYAGLSADLHNLYGPTEAAVDVTYWCCERSSTRLNVPIGRPIANTQIHILDSRMQPVPVGVTGELYIGGVNLARGYLGRPDLTAERFVPNPFSKDGQRVYRTGDLARFLADGTIEYLGRTDHQVKIRGFRIELPEIEAVLGKHPNIRAVALTVFGNQSSDPRLAAYFEGISSPSPSVTELRQFLLERLPEYMVPTVFTEMEHLPLTTSGKVDRRRLPEPQPDRPNLGNLYASPESDMETTLAEIWGKVLRIDRPGIHDNFFDLGGHSLRMTQVIAWIEQRTGQKLSIVEAFEHPTIHTMARYLSANGKPEDHAGIDRGSVRSVQKLRVDHLRTARQRHRSAGEA